LPAWWAIGAWRSRAGSCATRTWPRTRFGIDKLVERLADQPGVDAGPLTDVTIDGYSGTSVELTVTADITTCIGGRDGFWLWAGGRYASDPHDYRYVQDTNEMDRIYVLDVDGARFTFFARVPPGTTAAARAELEAIIDSIEIGSRAAPAQPRAPAPGHTKPRPAVGASACSLDTPSHYFRGD
jgi:hypothetical protein